MFVEVDEMDIHGDRVKTHRFECVLSASQYIDQQDGYEERVVVEHEDEDGNVLTDTIRSEYRVDITHAE